MPVYGKASRNTHDGSDVRRHGCRRHTRERLLQPRSGGRCKRRALRIAWDGVCVGGVGSSSARRWTRARGHAIAIARVTGFALALGLVIPGLDNAGHVGGTVSGALCGWVADATAQRKAPRKLS